MENDFKAKAFAELADTYEFIFHLGELDPKEVPGEIAARDPEFIQLVETFDKPPENVAVFWGVYVLRALQMLQLKYGKKLLDAFFDSDTFRQLLQKGERRKAIWSQIEEILKDSGFDKK